MDKNLEKLLNKSDNISEQQALLQPSDIMDKLQNNKNCMVIMNDGPYKINVITNLLHQYISAVKSVWLVTSPITLSPFKLYGIKSGLGSELLSVRCHFEYTETNSPVTLWSVDLLRDNIDAICSHDIKKSPEIVSSNLAPDIVSPNLVPDILSSDLVQDIVSPNLAPGIVSPDLVQDIVSPNLAPGIVAPDILVIENLDMLGDEYVGSCMEQVILGLPLDIAIIAFISPASNNKEILDWLIKTRNGSWGELESVNNRGQELAYLPPDYDLIPLLQKKKIATKVKNSLKENRPIKFLANSSFLKHLMAELKNEELTPTLIIMPSQELCNQAAQNCPKSRANVSEILSNPQIRYMFDRYPVLKDSENVVAALYKQAGAFHSGDHPAWSELIEKLLSLNLIEAVFSTMYDAQSLITRVESVIFTTSEIVVPGQIQAKSASITGSASSIAGSDSSIVRPVSSIEFHRICQLTESMDNTDMKGCVVLAHGEDIDMTLLKDMHLRNSSGAVKSKFKCNIQSVLALAGSTNRGLQNSVMMSLWANQKEWKDTDPLIEKQSQLEEFIPEAKCGAPNIALTLIQKTQQFRFEIDQCNIKIEAIKKSREFSSSKNELSALKKQVSMLQFTIANLPCNDCVHKAECQELRYKKIREISSQYNDMIYQMRQSSSILGVDLADETAFLINMGLLDSDSTNMSPLDSDSMNMSPLDSDSTNMSPLDSDSTNISPLEFDFKLTPKGKIALQSGCSNPFYITELIWHKKDFPWSEELTIPVLAGFIELGQEETPLLVNDFVNEALPHAYQWIEECIAPIKKQLCLNGVAVPEPSFAQSALVHAVENGIGLEVASETTGISIGTITRLVQKARYIGFVFGFPTKNKSLTIHGRNPTTPNNQNLNAFSW
ncbi:MAG: hypothetical protein HQK67_04115 [Desulfamplus sp.]|nr:hypothetical protein [Desulfamplus sp.]